MKNRKLGPIDFLLTRKFDQFCVNYALGRVKDSAMAVQLHGEPTPQIVEKIRAEYATLQALSPDELKRRYKEESDQFSAEEERKLPFSRENAQADFNYWARASFWTVEEGLLLIMGRDPRRVTAKNIRMYQRSSEFARQFAAQCELARRAALMRQIEDSNLPGVFVAWAKRSQLEIDPALEPALEAFGVKIVDWQGIVESQGKTIDELNETLGEQNNLVAQLTQQLDAMRRRIEELEPNQSSEDSLGHKERTSLLKLVIGMAVQGYRFEPEKDRNSATREIADDLELLGIALDRDTILKWLREGASLLPRALGEG